MTYQKTDKDRLINEIIDIEFSMFDKVKGMNGRAPCQNNFKTFYAMRYSQHNAFSEKTLLSYKNDLINAGHEGRNLITEKYAYMMEFTDKDYYEERSEEHTSELQSLFNLVCRLLLEKKKVYLR